VHFFASLYFSLPHNQQQLLSLGGAPLALTERAAEARDLMFLSQQ